MQCAHLRPFLQSVFWWTGTLLYVRKTFSSWSLFYFDLLFFAQHKYSGLPYLSAKTCIRDLISRSAGIWYLFYFIILLFTYNFKLMLEEQELCGLFFVCLYSLGNGKRDSHLDNCAATWRSSIVSGAQIRKPRLSEFR